MKRALLKTVFAVAVFGLTLLILIPTVIAWQVVFATGRGAGGHYQTGAGPGLLPSIVILVILVTVSDRIVSYWFYAGGLSDERWSVLRDRPRSRKRN
jgi:hypothetical protein